MTEIWKPIPSACRHEVSSLGRVRVLLGGSRYRSGYVLKAHLDSRGYPRLWINECKRNVRVHVLVAEAFLGPKPAGHQCNHKDGNKSNARPENLEYVTQLENVKHAYRLGLYGPPANKRYSRADIAQIKKLRQAGFKLREIAAQYDAPLGTISGLLSKNKQFTARECGRKRGKR